MKEVRNFRESINKKLLPNIITYKERAPRSALTTDKRTYRITAQFRPLLPLMSPSLTISSKITKLNHPTIQNSNICKNLRNNKTQIRRRTKILDSNTFKFQPRTPLLSMMIFPIFKKITKKKRRINNGTAMLTPVIHHSTRQRSSPKKPVSSWLKFSHAQRLHLYAIFRQPTTSPHTIQVMMEIRSKYSRMIVFRLEAHRSLVRTQITALCMDILIQRHFQKFKIRT